MAAKKRRRRHHARVCVRVGRKKKIYCGVPAKAKKRRRHKRR